jgi:hypothetical protein
VLRRRWRSSSWTTLSSTSSITYPLSRLDPSPLRSPWGVLFLCSMHEGLAMEHGEIGDVFNKWSESGELRGNYLVNIGPCRARRRSHIRYPGWIPRLCGHRGEFSFCVACRHRCAARHVSCPTLAAAHYLRVASGNRIERARVAKKMDSVLSSSWTTLSSTSSITYPLSRLDPSPLRSPWGVIHA